MAVYHASSSAPDAGMPGPPRQASPEAIRWCAASTPGGLIILTDALLSRLPLDNKTNLILMTFSRGDEANALTASKFKRLGMIGGNAGESNPPEPQEEAEERPGAPRGGGGPRPVPHRVVLARLADEA